MATNMERGFRWVTWVISVLVPLPALLAAVDGSATVGEAIFLGAILFAFPWGVFYLIRWIVLRFRRAPTPQDL